jgi:hypothetical protein
VAANLRFRQGVTQFRRSIARAVEARRSADHAAQLGAGMPAAVITPTCGHVGTRPLASNAVARRCAHCRPLMSILQIAAISLLAVLGERRNLRWRIWAVVNRRGVNHADRGRNPLKMFEREESNLRADPHAVPFPAR